MFLIFSGSPGFAMKEEARDGSPLTSVAAWEQEGEVCSSVPLLRAELLLCEGQERLSGLMRGRSAVEVVTST